MNKLSRWFYSKVNLWLLIIVTVIFILFMIFVLPDQAEKADQVAQGADSPDMSFVYSGDELYNMAEQYGEAGRQEYIRARFTFDLIFPFVYGSFLVVAISAVLNKLLPAGHALRVLNLFPFLGVVFDFGENICASIVMAIYPQKNIILLGMSAVFTLVKWLFVYGSFVILVGGLLILGYRKFFGRK